MKNKFVSLVVGLVLVFSPFVVNAATHTAGTNVISNGTIYMVSSDNQLRPYTSAGAFLSYGFNNWNDVQQANSDDIALPVGNFIPPRDGKIICSDLGADTGTCYLITNSQKAAFTNQSVFTGLGYSFSNAIYGDVSFLSAANNISDPTLPHLPGTLINDNGTIKLIGSGGNVTVGIPSLAILEEWGYSLSDAVPANAADQSLQQNDILGSYIPGELTWADGAPPTSSPTTVSAPAPVVTMPVPVAAVPTPVTASSYIYCDRNTYCESKSKPEFVSNSIPAVQAKLAPLQAQLTTLQTTTISQECSGEDGAFGTQGEECLLASSQAADVSEYENAILSDFVTPVTNTSIVCENKEDNIFDQIFQVKMNYAQAYEDASSTAGFVSEMQGEQQQLIDAANAQITALNEQLQTVRFECR